MDNHISIPQVLIEEHQRHDRATRREFLQILGEGLFNGTVIIFTLIGILSTVNAFINLIS